MKLSQLIQQLEKQLEMNGDYEVYVFDGQSYPTRNLPIESVEFESDYNHVFLRGGDNVPEEDFQDKLV